MNLVGSALLQVLVEAGGLDAYVVLANLPLLAGHHSLIQTWIYQEKLHILYRKSKLLIYGKKYGFIVRMLSVEMY